MSYLYALAELFSKGEKMESVYKQDDLSLKEQVDAYAESIIKFESEMDNAVKKGDKFLSSLYKESIKETLRELASQSVMGPFGKVITMAEWVRSEVAKRKANNISKDKVVANISTKRSAQNASTLSMN